MADKQFSDLKIRTWFKMNNIKRNGQMSKDDFGEIADIFKLEYKLSDTKHALLNKWLRNGWNVLLQEGQELATSGKDGGLTRESTPMVFEITETLNSGGAITEDQYVKAFQEIVEVNSSLFRRIFEAMVSTFFDVYDTDGDGMISVEDMIRGLRCLGIRQDDATKVMFANMDRENKGKVSKVVYMGEWIEFMLGDKKDAPIASVLCRQ